MLKKYKKNFLLYILCISFLLLGIKYIVKILPPKTIKTQNIQTSIIEFNNDKTNIYVEYPLFKNDKVTTLVTNILYPYIKKFKKENINKKLKITYSIYNFDHYANIVFNINNSLNNIKYKNILIDLNSNKITYITNIYDNEYLTTEIYKKVKEKYNNNILNKIKKANINNFTYIINDNNIEIYFNNINEFNYIPYIIIEKSTK